MDLDTLLQGHRDAISVRRIYGDPVERDGVTIVPAGAWVIRDGEVTWKPAIDVTRLAAIAAVAYVAARLLTRR